jgi:hypothetical protein
VAARRRARGARRRRLTPAIDSEIHHMPAFKRFYLVLMAMVVAVAAPLLLAAPAAAQAELQDGPKSLVISYRTSATDRPAFRSYLVSDLAPRLRALQAKGEITGFRIYYSWYRQPAVWDAMVILHFSSFEAVTQWNTQEQTMPGGLDAKGLALADPVASYSCDLSWSHNPDEAKDGEVYYIIPYQYENADEYRSYVAGYVLPQFEGWIGKGVLSGYELYMNRFQTGAPWDSLFIQHYSSMAAFGRRQATTTKVREKLAADPAWKAWSDKKGGIRTESENSVAELIAH